MNLDFSYNKYRILLENLIESNYTVLTVKEYFEYGNYLPEKFVVLRHDVDSEAEYTLKIANLENELGIKSTYYFRNIDINNNKHIILKVFKLGHEIGYHYEVLDLANGDYQIAIKIFEEFLQKLRQICEVKTIAQHGSPIKGDFAPISFLGIYMLLKNILSGKNIITSYNNKDLWTRYDFRDYGLIGEAYISFDFNKVVYLSDSGRSCDSERYKIKDVAGISTINLNLDGTDDLINLINKGTFNKLYILSHVNQWKDNYFDWIKWEIFQITRNIGKTILKRYWKYKGKI
jgi:hypothetical protein